MNKVVKILTLEQVAEIYNQWIAKHFPADEIKPLKSIERMWKKGCYFALGLYVEQDGAECLAGYAFFSRVPGVTQILLDYLAILAEYRQKGFGGYFLAEMQEWLKGADSVSCDGILIETEDAEYAHDEADADMRRKRDAFYRSHGAIETDVRSYVYGVHYKIWNLPVANITVDMGSSQRSMEALYKMMIPGEKYHKYVKIYRKE